MTRLVTVAHGTRDPHGNAVSAAITAAAGARLGMPAVATYLELAEPSFGSVRPSGDPAVVVPLLLSTGHHVRVDLGNGRPLGPDSLLAAAQVERLLQAGATHGQPAVMVAAGSRDPEALRDLRWATRLLASMWGGPVRLATLGGLGERPADLVRPGDAVSPYLLAPGFFATRARTESLAAGATAVADVIGAHPAVVDLVVERAVVLLADRRTA
jgi:sirohydrochlorin ferrochelatase